MIGSTMMDYVYSRPAAAAEREELLENDGGESKRRQHLPLASTDLTK